MQLKHLHSLGSQVVLVDLSVILTAILNNISAVRYHGAGPCGPGPAPTQALWVAFGETEADGQSAAPDLRVPKRAGSIFHFGLMAGSPSEQVPEIGPRGRHPWHPCAVHVRGGVVPYPES